MSTAEFFSPFTPAKIIHMTLIRLQFQSSSVDRDPLVPSVQNRKTRPQGSKILPTVSLSSDFFKNNSSKAYHKCEHFLFLYLLLHLFYTKKYIGRNE